MSRVEVKAILDQAEQLLATAGALPGEAEQAIEKLPTCADGRRTCISMFYLPSGLHLLKQLQVWRWILRDADWRVDTPMVI